MGKQAISLLLLLVFPAVLLAGCSREQGVSSTEFYFDTVVQITLYDGAEATLEGAMTLCSQYEALFSRTRPDSEIYRLNHGEGAPMTLSAETVELLEQALEYCRQSNGKLDITVAAFTDLWDFQSESPVLPSAEELAQAAACVGYENVEINGLTVTLHQGVQVDLGAIAKGYIADRLVEYLREQGVTSALLNLGGNVYCLGAKMDGKPFSVGVQNPLGDGFSAMLSLTDQAAVTSGIYQRGFTLDGVRYHHILDTETGMPAQTGLASVTVISADSTAADALSTLCFLLGAEDGMALLEEMPDTEGVFVTESGQVYATSGAPV